MNRYQQLINDIHVAERSYVAEGLALWEISAGKLYREEFETWESFCEAYGVDIRRAQMLIKAACLCLEFTLGDPLDRLGSDPLDRLAGDPLDRLKSSSLDGLPDTERHARPLTRIPEFADRVSCWQEILRRKHAGERITTELVEQAAAKYLTPGKEPAKADEIDLEFTSSHQPEPYRHPKDYAGNGGWSGFDHNLILRLIPVIGKNETLMLLCLIAMSRGKATVTAIDAQLMAALGITAKTLAKTKKSLVEKQAVSLAGDTYTLHDINWLMRAWNKTDDYQEAPQEAADDSVTIVFGAPEAVSTPQLVQAVDYLDSKIEKNADVPGEQKELAAAVAALFLVAGPSDYWKERKGKITRAQLKDWTKPTADNKKKQFYTELRSWLKSILRTRQDKPVASQADNPPAPNNAGSEAHKAAMAILKKGRANV